MFIASVEIMGILMTKELNVLIIIKTIMVMVIVIRITNIIMLMLEVKVRIMITLILVDNDNDKYHTSDDDIGGIKCKDLKIRNLRTILKVVMIQI